MFILDLGIFKFQNATHNHSANFIKLIKEYQIGRIWDIYEKEGAQEKRKLIPSSFRVLGICRLHFNNLKPG